MSLVLIPVKIKAKLANGTAVAGATVRAVLTVSESDDGLVVPGNLTGVTDVNGELVLNLWPNSRGVNGSQYTLQIEAPGLFFSGRISVPEAPNTAWPVDIDALVNLPPYPARSAAETAQERAQGHSLDAQGFRNEAQGFRNQAETYKNAAAGSATSAAHIYPTPRTTDPLTREDGSPVQQGDEYFNTTDNRRRVRSGGLWVASDLNTATLAGATGAGTIGHRAAYTGAPIIQIGNRLNKVVDVREVLSSANTGAVNSTGLQQLIDYFSGTGDQIHVDFAFLRGTVRFAKQAALPYAVKLKRGVQLVNPIETITDTGPFLLMLDDAQNCDFFLIDAAGAAQYYAMAGLLIDGNKANNPTGGAGIKAMSLDFANALKRLKIQNVKGAGVFLENQTYNNAGNVRMQDCNMVRCDGAGLYVLGGIDTFLVENVMCEGNGGSVAGVDALANYVFENGTDQTHITLASCRAEARTTANGGPGAAGVPGTNIWLKNMNGGVLRLVGGYYMGTNGNSRDSDIRITTTSARVIYQSRRAQNTTGAVGVFIDDQVSGRQRLRADMSTDLAELVWNGSRSVIPTTGTGLLETFGDKASNTATRTASTQDPEAVIVANPGSLHHRTDQTGNGDLHVKKKNTDNTGWWKVRSHRLQTPATSLAGSVLTFTVAPAISDGNEINVALTGTLTVPVVTGGVEGNEMNILFIQDATGGRVVNWNAAYKAVTSGTSGTPNQQMLACFRRRNGAWVQVSNTGWYS